MIQNSLERFLPGVFPDVDHVRGLPLELLAAHPALEAALLVPHHVTLQRRPRRAHLGAHLAAEPVRVVDLEAVVGQRRLGGELHAAVLAHLPDRLLVVHRRDVVLEPVRRRERLAALLAVDDALGHPPLSQVHSLKRNRRRVNHTNTLPSTHPIVANLVSFEALLRSEHHLEETWEEISFQVPFCILLIRSTMYTGLGKKSSP